MTAMPAAELAITPAAERFARRMLRLSGLAAGAGLQLRVSPGGCAGYSTQFDVAAAPAPAESVLEPAAGLRLFVDAPSAQILAGATLDFVETATDAGLKVIGAPGAAACCGSSAPAGVTAVPLTALTRRPRP